MDFHLVLLMLIVLVAFSVGAATGFGNAIIALTLALNFFPIDFLIPVIVVLSIVTSLYLALRHRSGIDVPLLRKKILPYTLVGIPIGLIIFRTVRTENLKLGFGAFVLILSVFELIRTVRQDEHESPRPLGPFRSRLWLLGGGIIQGLWVSGGPLIAYWANRNITNKRQFRSTLSSLWLLLNTILLVGHVAMGRFTWKSAKMSAILLPFVLGGVVIGERLHDVLPEKSFRIAVYTILIFAGASVIITAG